MWLSCMYYVFLHYLLLWCASQHYFRFLTTYILRISINVDNCENFLICTAFFSFFFAAAVVVAVFNILYRHLFQNASPSYIYVSSANIVTTENIKTCPMLSLCCHYSSIFLFDLCPLFPRYILLLAMLYLSLNRKKVANDSTSILILILARFLIHHRMIAVNYSTVVLNHRASTRFERHRYWRE